MRTESESDITISHIGTWPQKRQTRTTDKHKPRQQRMSPENWWKKCRDTDTHIHTDQTQKWLFLLGLTDET